MPRSFKFAQVDAFTRKPLHVNPCAIIYDADNLTDEEMLAIAREMNLSETSFILKSRKADFRFRYFTPAEEIPLAGHPTIATVYSLLEEGRIATGVEKITVELQAGIINVSIQQEPVGPLISMTQLPPEFLKIYSHAEVAGFFSLNENDFLSSTPLQTVSTGTPMLMIPLKNRQALESIDFKASGFASFRNKNDFFSAHLFCLEGFTDAGRTSARHFCPPPDIQEDPFTGSATGAMACYLWRYALIEHTSFMAEQGHLMHRPGTAKIMLQTDGRDVKTVSIGGNAVTSMRGTLTL